LTSLIEQNNVLITDEGRAALCDFGLSQVIEDLGRPAGLTLSTPSMGPLRWQAPELAHEDETPRLSSDVWSFACTAFEVRYPTNLGPHIIKNQLRAMIADLFSTPQLLTTRHPYPHCKRDMQVMQSMQNHVKPSGSTLATILDVHADIGALLDDCWSFDPLKRPSMSQVRERLEAMCQSC
jgi:serine/threonine protein kinase